LLLLLAAIVAIVSAVSAATLTVDVSPVPISEPTSLLLLGLGFAGLAIFFRRQPL